MSNPVSSVCVCGAGTMGAGIAQVFATHGFEVILYDVEENKLNEAKDKISRSIQKLKTAENTKNTNSTEIQFVSELNLCVADLIIEAVVEKQEIKVELFNALIKINNPSTIFVTNTSSLSVTEIAEKLSRSTQFAGMHFFNPAPLMKLVEVVRTKYSSEETINALIEVVNRIDKTPVTCSDSPGFIVNRVARPYYLEALYLHEHAGIAIHDIDRLLESSGFKMGPFKLMDLIGNDINYSVSCTVHEALGNPERLKPSGIQKAKVASGSLGRKTGKGYYDYPAQ